MKLNWMRDASGKISWKRTLCTVVIAIGIVLGALVIAFSLRGGTIIKTAVNTMGEKFLGVPVSVEDVSFYPLSGKASLKNLVISNPADFKSDYLFKMGELEVNVAMLDLICGNIHIEQILVESPHVIFDKKLTTSNVNELLKILDEKYPPAKEKDEKEEEKEEEPADDSGSSVVIDEVIVREGKVSLNLVGSLPLPLAELHLTDIGKDGAMMPGQIIGYVFKQIIYGVFSAVGGVAEMAVDGAKAVGEGVVGGVKAIGSGIGSLFTSDDEETEKTDDKSDADKK